MAAESTIGAVFTICPVTGHTLFTGIETDEGSLALTPSFIGRVHCSHCNEDHPFSKANAWIGDGKPPPDAAA